MLKSLKLEPKEILNAIQSFPVGSAGSLSGLCAVGDVLRRLTGKALVRAQKAKLVSYFSPLQVGVAVPCGAEAVAHGWKIIMELFADDPDIVAVKVDSTTRSTMPTELKDEIMSVALP